MSPKVAGAGGQGCSHPARAPRGAQPHGAVAHTPMQGGGLFPPWPSSFLETSPFVGRRPSLRLPKAPRAGAVALPAPHLTVRGKRPDEK